MPVPVHPVALVVCADVDSSCRRTVDDVYERRAVWSYWTDRERDRTSWEWHSRVSRLLFFIDFRRNSFMHGYRVLLLKLEHQHRYSGPRNLEKLYLQVISGSPHDIAFDQVINIWWSFSYCFHFSFHLSMHDNKSRNSQIQSVKLCSGFILYVHRLKQRFIGDYRARQPHQSHSTSSSYRIGCCTEGNIPFGDWTIRETDRLVSFRNNLNNYRAIVLNDPLGSPSD